MLKLGTSLAEVEEFNRPLRAFAYQRLPATLTEKGWQYAGGLLFIGSAFAAVGLTCLAIAIGNLLKARPRDMDVAIGLFFVALVFSGFGLWFFAWAFTLCFRRTRILLDTRTITVERFCLLRRRQWTETLAVYEGVFLRERKGRPDRPSQVVQVVELRHRDPAKTVAIHETLDVAEAIDQWKGFCYVFRLPGLEADGGRVVHRPLADLEKPIRDLAARRRRPVSFDFSRPLPEGVEVRRADHEFVVTVMAPRPAPPGYVPMMVFFVIAALLVLSDGLLFGHYIHLGLGAAWLLVLIVYPFILEYTHDRLRLCKDTIRVLRKRPWGESRARVLRSLDIQGVGVDAKEGEVHIRTANTIVKVGKGLGDDGLAWLRDLIEATVSS